MRAVNANGDGAWTTTSTGTPDDHGDTRNTVTNLQAGTGVAGVIETRGDVDYFKFELTQASQVIIQGSSNRLLGGVLYDSAGVLVDRGSHSRLPHGRDAFLILERLEQGEYYVSAGLENERIVCLGVVVGEDACGPSRIGPYTLSFTTVPEPGSTRATARPLTLGTISGGTIDPENDTDFFSITLSETTHVIVWAAHKDVYLPYDYDKKYYERIDVDRTLLDSGGNPVAANLREKALDCRWAFISGTPWQREPTT